MCKREALKKLSEGVRLTLIDGGACSPHAHVGDVVGRDAIGAREASRLGGAVRARRRRARAPSLRPRRVCRHDAALRRARRAPGALRVWRVTGSATSSSTFVGLMTRVLFTLLAGAAVERFCSSFH